ncbi:hypothetical protein ASPWEDRAFT_105538 [Aspergillus wentii DTO 134E9]|uniref:G-protein coupled receptors family 2 profile 2 domain-containing protein n=1 Tax=Aspergillus wentii DTO 134E9 TaxID=1073089 RepID=A0A1L9RTF8_ASPWE|nr:uncharacterized protein ASPWEDRAFT_105538 [Aspergillus wentii DTO 134E9]KAI9933746.1 hypothetical protein MW887_004818 [Aspergillus wentii]OJJ38087.1 hypothetical protein ASPWEDRAFT_105538 [Aspergillus wentii DTO 134E9]
MTLNGSACPAPFLLEALYPREGGYIPGRYCKAFDSASCCLPCPVTNWRYPDEYQNELDIPGWIAVVVLVLVVWLLLTFLLLHPDDTWRHYLSTTPLLGFVLVSLAFIIPLNQEVNHCYDAITPNDWRSDTRCAFTGILLMLGVWIVVISCFFRSVSLYLHLCWEVDLGQIFMYTSLTTTIVGSIALVILLVGVSGISYQVGKTCYISIPHSKATFWGPMMAVAALSIILQTMIIAFCVYTVVRPVYDSWIASRYSSDEESIISYTAFSARQASRRVLRILRMQWRAIAIVVLVLIHVVFMAIAFQTLHLPEHYSLAEVRPWFQCLINSNGDKNECLSYAKHLGPSRVMCIVALSIVSSCGIWGPVCCVRSTMAIGWIELFRGQQPTEQTPSPGHSENPDIETLIDSDSHQLAVVSPGGKIELR